MYTCAPFSSLIKQKKLTKLKIEANLDRANQKHKDKNIPQLGLQRDWDYAEQPLLVTGPQVEQQQQEAGGGQEYKQAGKKVGQYDFDI